MFLDSLTQQFHRCILKISGMKEFLWYFHSNETSLELQQLTQIFQLPHTVALEPYIRVFQYKVLNGILDTNPSCMKQATFQAISVSSVPGHQSRCIISFIFLHFQRLFGPILNLFGTYSQMKKYNYHCKTL